MLHVCHASQITSVLAAATANSHSRERLAYEVKNLHLLFAASYEAFQLDTVRSMQELLNATGLARFGADYVALNSSGLVKVASEGLEKMVVACSRPKDIGDFVTRAKLTMPPGTREVLQCL